MGAFRMYLVIVIVCLGTYTVIVGLNALDILGIVGGMMVLAPYLFIASIEANGDVKVLMLGKDSAVG